VTVVRPLYIFIGLVIFAVVVIHYATNANARFCLTHHCIGNFGNGHGTIVQCNDGEWSHSGGLPGACSYHGGEK
jgi:hypothetical protein